MNIVINNKTIEVFPGETLLEVARRTGHIIPSLCYAKDARHKSSCMVCVVKDCVRGQIIPSCTTMPTEGMQIETDTEEVKQVRSLSLELLLSDHRADCDAPCSMVCPKGLDVERVLGFYDHGLYQKAYALLEETFTFPETGCDACKAPCEKACRRGMIDKAVSIRAIIREIAEKYKPLPADTTGIKSPDTGEASGNTIPPVHKKDKNRFQSRLGRFSEEERERLKETVSTPSRCLHCACAGQKDCKLRVYATDEGIKRPRYDASSSQPVMNKVHITKNIWFEQAKCIRCGLCVYNSDNGFTFKDRGFGMQVVIPDENRANITENLAELCPTGAIYIDSI